MKQKIIKELKKQNSKIRVVFPTSALSTAVHMSHILQELCTLAHHHLLKNVFRKLVELEDLGCSHMRICSIINQISQIIDQKGAILQNQR